MKGMELLMKTMGVDPDMIKEQIGEASNNFKKVVEHFDKRLNNIETKLNLLLQNTPLIEEDINGEKYDA